MPAPSTTPAPPHQQPEESDEEMAESEDIQLDYTEDKAEAETDKGGEGVASVVALTGAIPVGGNTSPSFEDCGCSSDVVNKWMKSVENGSEHSFQKALNLLSQTQSFEVICDPH